MPHDPLTDWGVIADAGHNQADVDGFIATHGGTPDYWDELLASARMPQP